LGPVLLNYHLDSWECENWARLLGIAVVLPTSRVSIIHFFEVDIIVKSNTDGDGTFDSIDRLGQGPTKYHVSNTGNNSLISAARPAAAKSDITCTIQNFYSAVTEKYPGAHFARPFIMMMRENESDMRFIRYIISVPDGMDMYDRAILNKIEPIQNEISQNITKESLTHLTTDIGDVLALSNEGFGIQSIFND
jgi:hypothetical protein